MKQDELDMILALHKAWLSDKERGVRADFEDAKLVWANLEEANLMGVKLMRANLTGANLEEANLMGVKLMRANLEGANLRGANLIGANLAWANLEGANLSNSLFRHTNLEDATYNKDTIFPDDFDPIEHHMILIEEK